MPRPPWPTQGLGTEHRWSGFSLRNGVPVYDIVNYNFDPDDLEQMIANRWRAINERADIRRQLHTPNRFRGFHREAQVFGERMRYLNHYINDVITPAIQSYSRHYNQPVALVARNPRRRPAEWAADEGAERAAKRRRPASRKREASPAAERAGGHKRQRRGDIAYEDIARFQAMSF